MPTLDGILREIAFRHGSIAEVYDIASLTTTTAVVTSLATGGISSQAFVEKWMVRPENSNSADLIRRCTAFASSTGTLTHAGTNYADTTATSEQLLVLKWRLMYYLNSIDVAVGKTKRLHESVLPTLQGARRYWLSDFSWIDGPGDIESIWWTDDPNIVRNRYFEDYNTYNSSGVLVPDHWAISGASATMARSTTQVRRGQYSLAITRSGTDCAVSQIPGLLISGVSGDSLVGKTITIAAWCWSAVASQVRIRITDGVDTTNSSYHTGGSTWEELTATHTVNSAATSLTVSVRVESDNTVCYIDEYAAGETYDDAVRRDAWPRYQLGRTGFIQNGALAAWLPERGHNGQYIVKSYRPYPRFDATRLADGTALGDTTDCPLEVAVAGGVGRLYEVMAGMEEEGSPDREKYVREAALWNKRWEGMVLRNQASSNDSGLEMPAHRMGMAARRP